MWNQARLILAALALAGCRSVAPPRAAKIPHVTEIHGNRYVDDYFWLRDRDDPRVLAYLQAENAYTERVMKPTERLQETLYKEMLGRIEETDSTVPYRQGAHFYYSRTEQGKQYPSYCRKPGSTNAAEEVLLDLNALAAGKPYLDLGVYEVSDNGARLAYALDFRGAGDFTLFVKELATGKIVEEVATNVASVAWAADNATVFYVTQDAAKRPHRLYRHRLGAAEHTLLYEETDERFWLSVSRTRSRQFIVTTMASKTTTEVRVLPAAEPTGEWRLIAPREEGREYYVNHSGELFYIRTNDKGRNFRLVTAPVGDPSRQNWREVVPHRAEVMIAGLEAFANHYVLIEREDGLPQVRITQIANGATHRIEFREPAYSIAPTDNATFDTPLLRVTYESLVTPPSVFDYDMNLRARYLLKRQPVKGGYDPRAYEIERQFALAPDHTLVPVSLVYRRDKKREAGNPLLLDAYGAYGLSEDVWFSSSRLSLLDRGVVFAIAHVRGGGEYGKRWHDAGRMLNKRNTFTDLIAAAQFLIANGYTTRDQLALTGGSAGGLTVGAALNLRPDLCRAALLDVPFLDVINTMLDEAIPLTVTEFEEWGNPKIRAQYDYMKSYSPYDTVVGTNYPALLVKTSLNDSRVAYWEPAKFVAKLRATQTGNQPLLLKIDRDAGHAGPSGRYDYLRDAAFDYAWLLTQWGLDRQD
jgi:oligopeptidase B